LRIFASLRETILPKLGFARRRKGANLTADH
jgi:hypothetical protein